MIDFSKFKKALVIGAGSGRDIASAIMITEQLRAAKLEIDLAGFLTPWSLHQFEGQLEKTINTSLANSKKFIPPKVNVPLNCYFEPVLHDLVKKHKLGIENIFLFSLQYGIEKLKKDVGELIYRNNYDLIIIVDVGGDALASRKTLRFVSTPIVDLSCLKIFSEIKTNADKILAVVCPGADKEIPSGPLSLTIKSLEICSNSR